LQPAKKVDMINLKLINTFIICFLFFDCNYTQTKSNRPVAITETTQKTLDRPHYQMNYYSDWSIDSTDKDFDLDSYFSLNTASGSGTISFFIYNTTVDEKKHLDAQIKAHLDKIMKDGNVSLFETWGKYKGHGAIIDGKISGTMRGEVTIFVHSCDTFSFLVAYQLFKSDKERDLPGFHLIEKTFKMK
jgi:hypothetical protein